MRRSSSSNFVIIPLFIGMLYHGIWNITGAGGEWWLQHLNYLPLWLRYIVGPNEILIALALLSSRFRFPACLLGSAIMLTACLLHLNQGFSYKYGGFEVPFLYLCLFLSVLSTETPVKTRV
jgi:uncharacterized membrane protein YphA (DoxX/SURF4 family)